MPLLTPTDIRLYLTLNAGQDEELLLALCAAAEAFVLAQISMKTFDVTSVAETYNGNGASIMILDRRPIVDITEVMIDGKVIPAAASWNSNGWLTDLKALYLRGWRFTPSVQNVRVTYTAGYAVVPEDLKRAAIDIVAEKYARRTRQGVTSKSIGSESITYGQNDVTPYARQVFGQYKRPMLARL